MRTNGPRVRSKFVEALEPAVGCVLESVTYSALNDDVASTEDFARAIVVIGGEVVLQFRHLSDPVFLGWDENAGWPDHFSVQACRKSTFGPGFLRDWPANEAPQWRGHVGKQLLGAEVYALSGTPHVVALRFSTGVVAIADSRGECIGDGDDVSIRQLPSADVFNDWELVWRSRDRTSTSNDEGSNAGMHDS